MHLWKYNDKCESTLNNKKQLFLSQANFFTVGTVCNSSYTLSHLILTIPLSRRYIINLIDEESDGRPGYVLCLRTLTHIGPGLRAVLSLPDNTRDPYVRWGSQPPRTPLRICISLCVWGGILSHTVKLTWDTNKMCGNTGCDFQGQVLKGTVVFLHVFAQITCAREDQVPCCENTQATIVMACDETQLSCQQPASGDHLGSRPSSQVFR